MLILGNKEKVDMAKRLDTQSCLVLQGLFGKFVEFNHKATVNECIAINYTVHKN